MTKTVFNAINKTIQRHGDKLFIISMLTLVMIAAFAFKKPNDYKVDTGAGYTNVEYKHR